VLTRASPRLTIDVASVPDRERVVAEIFFDDGQWAEVLCENDEALEVECYPKPDGSPWRLRYDVPCSALDRAARALRGT
jgi:hypothetical protein